MKGDNQDLTHPIQLYRTAVTSSMISGPTGFSDEMTKKFGFTPVQDDDTALEKLVYRIILQGRNTEIS